MKQQYTIGNNMNNFMEQIINKEDRERVINKYVSSVDVKVLEITNDV